MRGLAGADRGSVRDGTRLSLREKVRLGTEIVTTYGAVRWWLLSRSVTRAVADARDVPPSDGGELPLRDAIRLGWAVQRTLGLVPLDSKCLIRSLVLVRLLARRGMTSTLVLGVANEPSFAAHAWVERDGVALLPTGPAFHRLTEL